MTPLPTGVWAVDSQRSQIGFTVREMWGLRTVRGSVGEFEGSLIVQADGVTGELTIDADSLDTGNRRRDKHLRSPAFFDVDRHPQIVFTVTGLDALAVTGDLAIGGAREQLEIPVEVEEMDDGALLLEGKTAVSRRSAGLTWNMMGMIRGDALLHAHLTLRRVG